LEFYPSKIRYENNIPYDVRENSLDIHRRLTDDDPTNDPVPAFAIPLAPGEEQSTVIK
jgi:hypothetical protein